MSGCHSSELLARCGQKLSDHLFGVRDLLKNLSPKTNLKDFNRVLSDMGFLHDIGKAVPEFQEPLKLGKQIRYHHELLSSLVSYYYLSKKYNKSIGNLGAAVILSHHDRYQLSLKPLFKGNENIAYNFIKDYIKRYSFDSRIIDILENFDYRFSWNFLLDKKSLLDILESWRKFELENVENTFPYVILPISLGYLTDADFFNSSTLLSDWGNLNSSDKLTFNDIVKYTSTLRNTSKISKWRENLSDEVNSKLNQIISLIENGNRIIKVDLPTGAGKTLINMKLATSIKEKCNMKGPIIYSLPFLSIIDQVVDEFKRISKISNKKIGVLRYDHTEHDFKGDTSNKELSDGVSNFLIESWNSNIIVTTLNQLIAVLLTYGKRKYARKLKQLFNSVIIIDEVQSIPLSELGKIEYLLGNVLKELNSILILSTATHPPIFEKSYTFKKNLPSELSRQVIYYNPSVNSLDKLIDEIKSKYKNYNNMAIVLNTIKSMQMLYKKLVTSVDYPVYALSTMMFPQHRHDTIEYIKKMIREKENFILVSTQVIEAGVDLDFNYMVRDFAPIDSIIQSAGRCNRNGKLTKGKVNVVRLIDEDNKEEFCKEIYDDILIDVTSSLLTTNNTFKDRVYNNLLSKYFVILRDKKNLYKNLDEFKEVFEKREYSEFNGKDININLMKDSKIKDYKVYVPENRVVKLLKERLDLINKINELSYSEKFYYLHKLWGIQNELDKYSVSLSMNEFKGLSPVISRNYDNLLRGKEYILDSDYYGSSNAYYDIRQRKKYFVGGVGVWKIKRNGII